MRLSLARVECRFSGQTVLAQALQTCTNNNTKGERPWTERARSRQEKENALVVIPRRNPQSTKSGSNACGDRGFRIRPRRLECRAQFNESSLSHEAPQRGSPKDFVNPEVGFKGAGKKGAERLRELSAQKPMHALTLEALSDMYVNHARKKPKWAAEKDLDKGFGEWIDHKVAKWQKRVK